MNYGFIIDNRRCIGCHACTVACKSEHNTPIGVNRTWVKYIEKGVYPDSKRIFTVTRCNHCADAPCVEICPVTSLFIRPDGIVDFDSSRCIGCKACMQACPYDALYIDPETRTSAKCNYCAHRVEHGIEPACVVVCPVQAIISGDMDDPGTEISQLLSRQQTTVRKPEKGTSPKLFYINADQAALSPTAAPPRNDYFGTEQAGGVGHHAHSAAENPASPERRTKLMGLQDPAAKAARRTYDPPAKGVLWDWEVSGYLWTKSVAAGVIFLPLLLDLFGLAPLSQRMGISATLISLVFLALTGLLLVKDLDRPERFLNVLLRPQWRSWLVRGAYIITAFGAFSTLWLLQLFSGSTGAGWFRGLLSVLAIMTAVYTAFLFAQAKGRDLWQSPMLPLRMLLTSIMTGSALLLLAALVTQAGPLPVMKIVLMTAIVVHLLMVLVEFKLPHVTGDAAEALSLVVKGTLKLPFWSSLVLGNLLPLLLLWNFESGLALFPTTILVLTFALVHEHVWVRAPQLVPLR